MSASRDLSPTITGATPIEALPALIAKLEAATTGSRDLDLFVAQALGWPWSYTGEPPRQIVCAPLTLSTDAALSGIDRSTYGLYSVDASIEGRFSVVLKGPDRLWPATEDQEECVAPGWEGGTAPTLPLALCTALLRALTSKASGEGE